MQAYNNKPEMPFKQFIKQYQHQVFKKVADKHVIVKYEKYLPPELILFWKMYGWSGYNNGLFWIVNPDQYEDSIPEWIAPSRKPVVIARTAFADLFVWVENAIYFLDIQYGGLTELDDDITRFFDLFLCDKELVSEASKEDLFNKVYHKLGPLMPDECYGFVPVLILGGSGNAESVEKVKIIEYLYLLSKLLEDN